MDFEDIGDLEEHVTTIKNKMRGFSLKLDAISTYLLGLTGSGKSTLTNYLLGAELTFERKRGKWTITNKTQGDFPKIGNTHESCTDIPSVFDANGMVLVDPAGFLDTKGPVQQIINSYANAMMFKRGGKTRILLVIESSTLLSGRGGSLVDVAVRLRQLFPTDFNNLIHSCMIVISKANVDDMSEEDAEEIISDIIRSNKNLPPECQMMINTILQFKRYLLFPIPKQITPDTVQQIKTKIEDLRPCTLSANATVSLSPSAKLKLDDLSSAVADILNNCAKQIRSEIEMKFTNKYYKTSEELEPIIGKLRSALSILTNEMESGYLESFERFSKHIDLSEAIENKVKENYDKMEFCRALLSQVRTNVKLVDSIINSLRESLSILEAQLQKLSTKEEIDKMNARHEQDMANRKAEFNQMMTKMDNDAKQRQERAKKDLQDQRELIQNQMADSQKGYQETINVLQKQLQELKNRPPQVVTRTRKVCSIM